MKVYLLLVLVLVASNCAPSSAQSSPIEAAIRRVVATFQEVTRQYTQILQSFTRSLGIPAYRASTSVPGLKQLEETIKSMQATIQEAAMQVNRAVTNKDGAPNVPGLSALQDFLKVFQQQLNELTETTMKAINGGKFLQTPTSPIQGIPFPFAEQLQQIMKQIQATLQGFVENMSRLVPGGGGWQLTFDDPAIPGLPGSDGGLIVVSQFQQLIGAFSKQVSSLLSQFSKALTQSGGSQYHYY